MTRSRVALAVALGAALVMGCGLIAGLEDRALIADAGTPIDAPFDAVTNASFTLAVSPPSIVLEPNGPGVPVDITITRKGGFSEAIAVSLSNPPTGISGSAVIPGNSSTGTLNVFANASATVGQVFQGTVSAQGTPSGVAATQPLLIRVGHLVLATNQGTTFVVPPDVKSATVAVWGGGGGGGGTATTQVGGAGGAGGFAEATFPVTPGETLNLLVATGGAGSIGGSTSMGAGGSGGGYSAVVRGALGDGGVDASSDAGDAGAPSPYLIVAGGGGGGGGGFYYTPNQIYSGPGKVGGDGSGANGTDGIGALSGKGATMTAGGAGGTGCGGPAAGTSLQGASANSPNGDAGVPGGGRGGSSAGAGGGGGFFGGGAGGSVVTITCSGGGGGGGGSGHVDASGTKPTASAGTGVTPPSTNHKYYVAGVGTGGAAAAAGGGGRIVIYLP